MAEKKETDWGKIAMGVAVAVVFVMQQYHAMKLNDLKATVVPRTEIDAKSEKLMDKDEILDALKMLNARMNAMEKIGD